MRVIVFSLLLSLLVAPLAAQQTVALPHGTGNLTVPANWTVLGAEELTAETRPSDPAAEPARTLLVEMIRLLNEGGRTSENLLLHQPGSTPGQLRIINAYSTEHSLSAEQVQSEEFVEQSREALEQVLGAAGAKVDFHGKKTPELFPVGSLSLLFRTESEGVALMTEYVVVPAGERLQYFEIGFTPDDLDAATAAHGVISAFDGASEPDDDTTRNMILGGVVGAVAGMCAALASRRRQRRVAIERAEEEADGRGTSAEQS